MLASDLLHDTETQQRRFRTLVGAGVGILLIFSISSCITLLGQPTRADQLSAATDLLFTLSLVCAYILLPRLPLEPTVLCISAAILIYSVCNIIFFPTALLRAVGQPLLAVMIVVPFVGSARLRLLSVVAWISIAALFALSDKRNLSGQPWIDFGAMWGLSAMILLVLNQFHTRINEALQRAQVANDALRATHTTLEQQVAERTLSLERALAELRARSEEQARLLSKTEQQGAMIRALSLPVLPINRTTLAIPLIGDFDSGRMNDLQERIVHAVAQFGARALVVDITGMAHVDGEFAAQIIQTAQAVQLMGARIVLAGIRPEIAQAIVSLGIDLQQLQTAPTLQEGIAKAA